LLDVSGARRCVWRAELMLGDGLPGIEIELPADISVARGDVLAVQFRTVRLFSA